MTKENLPNAQQPENNREKWQESNRNRMSRPHTPAPELIGEMEDMRKELEILRVEHYENLLKPTPEEAARAATLAAYDKAIGQIRKIGLLSKDEKSCVGAITFIRQQEPHP